ncbi:MAG: AAC(3) family N-acetyltransferase [Verrucomicrobia bacterium]|nr:AAC(3) family N-acetyltransferase [Verrucomicrobiota bacterium]
MKKPDIVKALKALGLRTGDHVILHSSLSSIGHVSGGADTVIDAFLNVLGKNGTLVVPTFGKLGIITEVVKTRPNAVRSIHPLASVAAIGGKANEICKDHWKAPTAHGAGTPYTRLSDLGGIICLLGVDHDRNTTLHTVEALLKLPYLARTTKRTFDTPEGPQTKSWDFFPGPHRNFIGLDRLFTAAGKQTIGSLGNATVRLIKARDLIELGLEVGKKDPAFALCENPACADCVAQRAALRPDVFQRKPYTVAASAALAGRTVPEMIENLRAAGIAAVELDAVQGRSVEQMSTAEIKRIVSEFKAAEIQVIAVRLHAITKTFKEILKATADAKIAKVVMPLSAQAADHARAAKKLKLKISFFNVIHDSAEVSDILLELKQKRIQAGFTFNAAAFARAGEKPFLVSSKAKLNRFIDGLDIEDMTFDGLAQEPAHGNAEIREMVSILNCHGFNGTMTLGAGNRNLVSLRRLAEVLSSWITE